MSMADFWKMTWKERRERRKIFSRVNAHMCVLLPGQNLDLVGLTIQTNSQTLCVRSCVCECVCVCVCVYVEPPTTHMVHGTRARCRQQQRQRRRRRREEGGGAGRGPGEPPPPTAYLQGEISDPNFLMKKMSLTPPPYPPHLPFGQVVIRSNCASVDAAVAHYKTARVNISR